MRFAGDEQRAESTFSGNMTNRVEIMFAHQSFMHLLCGFFKFFDSFMHLYNEFQPHPHLHPHAHPHPRSSLSSPLLPTSLPPTLMSCFCVWPVSFLSECGWGLVTDQGQLFIVCNTTENHIPSPKVINCQESLPTYDKMLRGTHL